MDKWLGLQSTFKTQKISSKNQKQKHQQKEKKQQAQPVNQDRIKEEQDLQLALEESRLASDIEKAIALSLLDARQHTSSQHAQQTTPTSSQSTSTRRSGSKPSTTTSQRPPSVSHRNNLIIPLSSHATTSSSDTWAVETFVNELLNPKSPKYDSDDSQDEDISPYLTDLDDDATFDDDDDYQERTQTTPETKPDDKDDDDDNWEISYDSGTEAPLSLDAPKQPLSPSPPTTTDDFHDEQAEAQFFGQLRRETWDKDDIRSTHDAMKKRSMATAIKKNKSRRTNSSHPSSTSDDHDYYATADDVLEGAFEAAGFGDSAAGLSWEGVGQSRYA